MRRIYRRAKPKAEKNFRANLQIKSELVFLIDADGQNVGEVKTGLALKKAEEAGLDLVEVNPTANPPIAKIMDFGQFKYEKDKQTQKQKAKNKKTDTKILRLSARIGSHDLLVRQEQAKKFLQKGNKLKLELRLKGRERQHPELGLTTLNRLVQTLQADTEFKIAIEEPLTKQGGQFTILLSNKNS